MGKTSSDGYFQIKVCGQTKNSSCLAESLPKLVFNGSTLLNRISNQRDFPQTLFHCKHLQPDVISVTKEVAMGKVIRSSRLQSLQPTLNVSTNITTAGANEFVLFRSVNYDPASYGSV